jgi:hypothetical protein
MIRISTSSQQLSASRTPMKDANTLDKDANMNCGFLELTSKPKILPSSKNRINVRPHKCEFEALETSRIDMKDEDCTTYIRGEKIDSAPSIALRLISRCGGRCRHGPSCRDTADHPDHRDILIDRAGDVERCCHHRRRCHGASRHHIYCDRKDLRLDRGSLDPSLQKLDT